MAVTPDFALTARADRLDRLADGRLAIIDYKTGAPPSNEEVLSLSPQLPLEALIARTGGFEGIGAAEVAPARILSSLRPRRGRLSLRARLPGRRQDEAGRDSGGSAGAHRGAAAGADPPLRQAGGGISVAKDPAARARIRRRLRPSRPRGGMVGGRCVGRKRRGMKVVDFDRTQDIQWRASNPAASAWVVANAGSGKTHVLTQRVIRLLLAGADPAAILCLTFTKVAAAEMAGRVFGMLGKWATLPDDRLRAEIHNLQGRTPYGGGAPPGAPALRPGAGDAGRAENPDDPCVLRAAAAPVPLRGERAGPVRHPRRHAVGGADARGAERGDGRGCFGARGAAWPCRALPRRACHRRPDRRGARCASSKSARRSPAGST